MEANFSAGETGVVWMHGVPLSVVEEYGPCRTFDRTSGKKFKVADLVIQNVTIKLVSEDYE